MIGILSIITIAIINAYFVNSAHKHSHDRELIVQFIRLAVAEDAQEVQEKYEVDKAQNSMSPLSLYGREGSEHVKFRVKNHRLVLQPFHCDDNITPIDLTKILWQRMLVEEVNQVVGDYEAIRQIFTERTDEYFYKHEQDNNNLHDYCRKAVSLNDTELLRWIINAFLPAKLVAEKVAKSLRNTSKLSDELYESLFKDIEILTKPPMEYPTFSFAIISSEDDDFYKALASKLFKGDKVSKEVIIEFTLDHIEQFAHEFGDEDKEMITKVIQQKKEEFSTFRWLYFNIRHSDDKLTLLKRFPGYSYRDCMHGGYGYCYKTDEEKAATESWRIKELKTYMQEEHENAALLFLFNCSELKKISELLIKMRLNHQ